jgi:hypothetical protein
VISPSLELGGSSKDHPVTVFTSCDTLISEDSYTTSPDSSSIPRERAATSLVRDLCAQGVSTSSLIVLLSQCFQHGSPNFSCRDDLHDHLLRRVSE